MIFCSLSESKRERSSVRAEFKGAKPIGVVRLGSECFFFRRGFKVYYVAYEEMVRCFRRVLLIPMAGGKKNMKLETLVIADKKGELAQIQIPGADAARNLLEEIKLKAPHADFTCPDKTEEESR